MIIMNNGLVQKENFKLKKMIIMKMIIMKMIMKLCKPCYPAIDLRERPLLNDLAISEPGGVILW